MRAVDLLRQWLLQNFDKLESLKLLVKNEIKGIQLSHCKYGRDYYVI